MDFILLTQYDGAIIGPIAKLMGFLMNGIFYVIDKIGLPNIGLAIILFTIVVNILMLPLNIKQQKFGKLQAKINPEIQAIQAKYKGKTDQESMMAQNQETQAVYAKYGVSPSGSCLQLLIQMPILFSLYRVIQSMPAYVTKIGNTFRVLAEKIISVDNGAFLKNSEVESIASTVSMYGREMTDGNLSNGIIDVLNKLSSTDLNLIAEHYGLSGLTYEGQLIFSNDTTRGLIDTFNNFFGLNMGDAPQTMIKEAFAIGAWGIVIGAILIPVLSAVTQWVNVKLMPSQQNNDSKKDGNDMASSMAQSMKTMNMIMPIMSAWFCFTLPAAMGLYWVAGSVVRSIQQVIINKHIDKMDFDKVIAKNAAKSAKKLEKMQETQKQLEMYANMKTKNIQSKANISSGMTEAAQEEAAKNATSTTTKAKPGSMMAKANMVKDYNEKNNNR